jgi:hypothetical protein
MWAKILITLALAATDPMATNMLDIPVEYQKATKITLHTEDTQEGIDRECGKSPPGYYKIGCRIGRNIYLINPCLHPDASDYSSYAHDLCHEIAHSEGWHHINE